MNEELNEFDGFDPGWRIGIFDYCNGKPKMRKKDFPKSRYNTGFSAGYKAGRAWAKERIANA